MTSCRTVLSGVFSGLVALSFSACSGDPGSAIPEPAPAPTTAPPVATDPAPSTPPAPGKEPAPGAAPATGDTEMDIRWDPSVGAADCASAWGTNGDKLSSCDTVKDDYVVVHKSKRNVALCKNGSLVKNLRSGLGFAPAGDKVKEGDGKTPEGVFYVPRLVPNSTYYKAFLLSYPSVEDATRGVSSGLITQNQRSQIVSAHAACVEPPQNTMLGGDLELHGNGSSADWTAGCVAMDDSGIDFLWASIGVGDTIVIVP